MNHSPSPWATPGKVDIHSHASGLTSVVLRGAFGSAEFFTQGAHLTRFAPSGQPEMLFLSKQSLFTPGKAIRGGIPVIFPWFGPREGHPESPMHGLVRTREWNVHDLSVPDSGDASITFTLESDADTLRAWPHPFALKLQFLLGATLRIVWEVRNTGSEPFHFEQALHPYFPVSDVHRACVRGLQNARFLDKTSGPDLQTDTSPGVHFTRETDRLYLDTTAPLVLEDPASGHRLAVTKTGSQSSVVWNPWIAKAAALADLGDDEWQHFVCVEQVNAKHNAVVLAAGATHRMEAAFTLEKME